MTTQGHVLRVPDLLATLTTEAVVHHLDLVLDLPDAPLPGVLATRVAVTTMDGLLSDDAVRPAAWSDADYLLKATGRLPLTDRDQLELGEVAGWFPCWADRRGRPQTMAMSTKRDRWSCAATVTVSVGPFLCLATMKSASPARGDSLS